MAKDSIINRFRAFLLLFAALFIIGKIWDYTFCNEKKGNLLIALSK